MSLANVPLVTSAYQIGLSWSDGAHDGGSPVLDYRVSFAVQGEANTIFSSGLINKFETVTGLTPGVTYQFVVESRNLVGYSPLS